MKTNAKKWTRAAARRRHARAIAAGGYTRDEIACGDFAPLLALLPRALAKEVRAARTGGEPLHTPSK